MASAFVADTHATIWYLLDDPRLSSTARQEMENAAQAGLPIYIPSITLVEIACLVEKGRVTEELFRRLVEALNNPENVVGAQKCWDIFPLILAPSVVFREDWC